MFLREAMNDSIGFEALGEADLGLLRDWLQDDFVRSSFTTGDCSEVALRDRYLPEFQGRNESRSFIISADGKPVGFIHSFLFFGTSEWSPVWIGSTERVFGFDMFVAGVHLAGRGVGTRSLRQYLTDYIFGEFRGDACVVTPDPTNIAALKLYEKLGFEPSPTDAYPNMRLLRKPQFLADTLDLRLARVARE